MFSSFLLVHLFCPVQSAVAFSSGLFQLCLVQSSPVQTQWRPSSFQFSCHPSQWHRWFVGPYMMRTLYLLCGWWLFAWEAEERELPAIPGSCWAAAIHCSHWATATSCSRWAATTSCPRWATVTPRSPRVCCNHPQYFFYLVLSSKDNHSVPAAHWVSCVWVHH